MNVISDKSKSVRAKKIRKAIQSAGDSFGSVTFIKRSDGSLRSMAYRLHCQNPSFAEKPTGRGYTKAIKRDAENMQMTVLDANYALHNKKGHIVGRGAWRTIPLENVIRVQAKGRIYRVPIEVIRKTE
jgi:hypothetical protein